MIRDLGKVWALSKRSINLSNILTSNVLSFLLCLKNQNIGDHNQSQHEVFASGNTISMNSQFYNSGYEVVTEILLACRIT